MAVNPEQYYTGDGSRTLFPFSFQYLEESDVKVSVDGAIKTQTTDYTFANATTISFNSAPLTDEEVRVYRDTNVDELKATFFAGSAIRANDLNDNLTQNNYAVQEIKAYTWDNETSTIHSDETWVSSDTQIATTAAMDQRFLDEADEVVLSTDTWVSDDDRVATTAAIDARFQDELSETITSSETWPDDDNTIATTAAIDNRIDTAITNDIGTDGTGITVTDDGDGTITLGLGSGSIDLDRIKASDIITTGETWANNDDTIATTAKIDDVIDDAITGDILVDSTGLSKSTSGGQITLGIAAGSVDLDRIKAGDIINLAEQNAGPTTADTSIFTSSAAAKRFDTLVQTATPSGSDYQVGKTWLQNDDDLTLSIWNGTGWTAVSSGGTFTEQPSVVYVDQASGDNANTGHRISTPKATIKAAIEQINAEIDIEITSGGSGYVEGSYTTVALTGGNGTGLTADITVNASGVVSAVTVNSTTTLEDYSIGDVLSASNTDLGGSGSGLQITVTGDGDGQIVIVSAGAYPEAAPIQIKRRNVSIIGQSLRSCIVHPTSATETNTLFELNSGSYISNLTLTGVKAGTGTGNTLDAVLPTTQGWNFAFYEDAFITKSPYIQNCTNFSDSEIENDPTNANYLVHNPAGGQAGDTDSAPTGGGLLVNGATPHDNSPLRSMVCDSYTHVGLNGPGILVTNNGYAQCTSSYAFFNKYHIKCLNGGQANLAASTTDFGDEALVADGRSTSAIFTSNVDGAATSGDTTFNINAPTAGASWFGSATRPQGNMLVTVNSVTYPVLSATARTDSEGGAGWTVEISRPNVNNRSQNDGLNGDVADDLAVSFFLRSQIASSGHTMEYVGSGTNYLALPENGGVPDDSKQIVESNGGKVWTAITDHNGKFKVGDFFSVDQRTGFVSITAGSYSFDVVSDATPQLGGNLDVQARTITTSTADGNITLDPNGTGTVDVSTSRITSVADPTAAQDAATRNYVDTEIAAISQDSITEGNTSAEVVDTGTDGHFKVTTEGTERLRVASNGQVGIGTDSPSANLHVRNPNASAASITLQSLNATHGTSIAFQQGNDVRAFINTEPGSNNLVLDPTGTGTVDVSSARITSVADPTGAQDAATRNFVDTKDFIQKNDSRFEITETSNVGQANLIIDNITNAQFTETLARFIAPVEATHYNVRHGAATGGLIFNESVGNGTNKLIFQAPSSITADVTFTLPDGDGSADEALTTNGSGTLSWASFIRADTTDTYTGGLFNGEETITASAFDLHNGHFWTCGAIAIPNPTNGAAGFSGLIRVTAAPTSFGSNWDFPGGSYTAPTAFPAVAPFYVVSSTQFYLGNWTEGIA